MDELKKYLQQNREALDNDIPSPVLWERIQAQQPEKKAGVVLTMVRWAVAACILVLAGIGTWSMLQENKTKDILQQPATVQNQPKKAAQPVTVMVPETKQEVPALTAAVDAVKKPVPAAKSAAKRPDLIVLENIEKNFGQFISLQRNKVSTIPMYAESAEYFNDFKVQISQLEKDEKTVKAEIRKHGLTDDLLNQLINLYQIKLSTLKQLQTEMNKINNRVKQMSRPVDSVKTYFINI